MTKRKVYITVSILLLVIMIISIVILAAKNSDYRTKHLAETMDINTEDITMIMLSHPTTTTGQYNKTMDPNKIDIFINYLDHVEYQRLSGDQSGYMPMRASMIYLYEGEEAAFIVPYEKEAMISNKVYRIKNGILENQFLIEFYYSIESEE